MVYRRVRTILVRTAMFQTIVERHVTQLLVDSAVLPVGHRISMSITMLQIAVKYAVIEVIVMPHMIVMSDHLPVIVVRCRSWNTEQRQYGQSGER